MANSPIYAISGDTVQCQTVSVHGKEENSSFSLLCALLHMISVVYLFIFFLNVSHEMSKNKNRPIPG